MITEISNKIQWFFCILRCSEQRKLGQGQGMLCGFAANEPCNEYVGSDAVCYFESFMPTVVQTYGTGPYSSLRDDK